MTGHDRIELSIGQQHTPQRTIAMHQHNNRCGPALLTKRYIRIPHPATTIRSSPLNSSTHPHNQSNAQVSSSPIPLAFHSLQPLADTLQIITDRQTLRLTNHGLVHHTRTRCGRSLLLLTNMAVPSRADRYGTIRRRDADWHKPIRWIAQQQVPVTQSQQRTGFSRP